MEILVITKVFMLQESTRGVYNCRKISNLFDFGFNFLLLDFKL